MAALPYALGEKKTSKSKVGEQFWEIIPVGIIFTY